MQDLESLDRETLIQRLRIAEAAASVRGGEWCAQNRAEGRGGCGACAWCCQQVTQERDQLKLERDSLARREIRRADCCRGNELRAEAMERERNDVVASLLYAAREMGLVENCQHTPAQMADYVKVQWQLSTKRYADVIEDLELLRRALDRSRGSNTELIQRYEEARLPLYAAVERLRLALNVIVGLDSPTGEITKVAQMALAFGPTQDDKTGKESP